MEYYSAIKRDEILPFAETWMDLETHTEWSEFEQEEQILYINAYLWNLEKNGIDELICKAEIETQT